MKKIMTLLLTLLVLPLSGCWDKKELEQVGFVMAIGLDKGDDNNLKITYQLSNPEVGTSLMGSPPQNEKADEIFSLITDDFLTGKNTANTFVTRKITFSQTIVLVVSEEIAKSDKMLNTLYSAIRDRELRKNIALVISKEDAETFIRNVQPKLETRPHKYYSMMLERVREVGVVPPSDLMGYFRAAETDADLFLAIYATTDKDEDGKGHEDEYYAGEIPKKGGSKAEFIGSAVFKQGRMIGKITGEETRLSLLLDESLKITDMLATFKDPLKESFRVAANVNKAKKTDINMNLFSRRPKISVTVPLTIEILSIPSMEDYAVDLKKQEILRKSIENQINEKLKSLVEKTRREFRAEPFNWSLEAQTHFYTMDAYEKYNWMNNYPKMDVETRTEVKISGFGQQIQTPELKEVKD